MKKKSLNLKVSFILLAVYVLTAVIDAFTFKSISLSSSILCIGALIAYMLFLRKMDTPYYMGILIFTFFAQYLGAMLSFYDIIPIYDLILHSSSGALLILLADYLLNLILKKFPEANIPLFVRSCFCFLFSAASAAVWEIWEFSGDQIFGLNSQIDLMDTMTDIIAGTCGAIVGSFILRLLYKKNILKSK